MTDVQRQLWTQLEVLPIDGGPTTHGFAARLAKENGWTHRFAQRAIDEYRRFLLLLASGEHPVSPSPVIDQVWHLHLLYTRSYWDELCHSMVGRPLHHMPSQGGAHEASKFADWYLSTLAGYRACFDSEPPPDIWPPPGTPHPEHRWADVRTDWVIAKPRLWMGVAMAIVAVLMLALAAGCAPAHAGQSPAALPFNPFDLRGPQFLALYAGVASLCLALAWAVRAGAMATGSTPPAATNTLNLYETAYLSGGRAGVVQAAAVKLAQQGLLMVNPKSRKLLPRGTSRPTQLDAIEIAIFDAIPNGGGSVSDLRLATIPQTDRIAESLMERGLVPDHAHIGGTRAMVAFLAWAPVVFGAIKIAVGLYRDRPVAYLVIATLITAVLAYMLCMRPMLRTRRGERMLHTLRNRDVPRGSGRSTAADAVLTSVALYGVTALAGTELEMLGEPLKPTRDAGGWLGTGCGGTGCGGSSCGSSCGGSCGGGGCGGCGGGGA